MKKTMLFILIAICAISTVFAQGAAEAKPFPNKDMTLIVPWNAGGSSDLIGRLLVNDMAKTFGVNINVVNTPGATGTVGMNDCLLKPHDGYTLIANATPYNHGIMGLADWSPKDWDFLAAYYVPGMISVPKNSPYKTFEDFYAALKSGVALKGGTAGAGSSGYTAVEVLKAVDPVFSNYQHIGYSGGAAAITATVAGEVDFTPQLSNEVIEMLRSGDLIALCTFTAEDLVLEGVDYTIPTIGKFLPATQSVLPLGDAFGLLFPSDVPQEAKDALESAFIKACESEAALRFASEKGVVGLKNMGIKESDALRDSTVMSIGYALYNSGAAPNSPAKYGY